MAYSFLLERYANDREGVEWFIAFMSAVDDSETGTRVEKLAAMTDGEVVYA